MMGGPGRWMPEEDPAVRPIVRYEKKGADHRRPAPLSQPLDPSGYRSITTIRDVATCPPALTRAR
jgi:hypothetical protein